MFMFESLPSTPFCMGRKVIEFVDSWPHLGHVLNVDGDDGMDINIHQQDSDGFVWSNKQCFVLFRQFIPF